VQTIAVCDSVAAAAEAMSRGHLRHMVVVDEAGLAVGVLSQHRLLERLGGAIIEDAWERKQSIDAARMHAELLLDVEHRFARLLADEPNRETIQRAMLEAALRLPELDMGGLFQQQPDGGYRLDYQHGLPAQLAAQLAELPAASAEAGLFGQGKLVCTCAKTTPLCIGTDLFKNSTVVDAGIRVIAVVPIRVGGAPRVCLYLGSRQVDSLALDTVTALDTLAHQFSQALERLGAKELAAAKQVALSHSEALLRTLVHTIPDLVWLKNPDGIYLACNPSFARFFGASEAGARAGALSVLTGVAATTSAETGEPVEIMPLLEGEA
jgi:PAS domain-containing protein